MKLSQDVEHINYFIMTEDQKLHLQFIQGVITRMNSNSTNMKGWMVAIVSAMLALYANSSNVLYIWIAIFPTLLFWFFDTYYLRLERQYRKLYNKVISNDSSLAPFDMNASKEEVCFFATLFRPVEWGIYLPVIALLIIGGILG